MRSNLHLPVLLLLAACAAGDAGSDRQNTHSYDGDDHEGGGDDEDTAASEEAYDRESATDGGTWLVSIALDAEPAPVGEPFWIDVAVRMASNPAAHPHGVALEAQLRHVDGGQSPITEPSVTSDHHGGFELGGTVLEDAGLWELGLVLRQQSRTESVLFAFEAVSH